MTPVKNYPLFLGGSQKGGFQRAVLADVPGPKNRNWGTKTGVPGPQKPERGKKTPKNEITVQKTGTRAHSPKPPFYSQGRAFGRCSPVSKHPEKIFPGSATLAEESYDS